MWRRQQQLSAQIRFRVALGRRLISCLRWRRNDYIAQNDPDQHGISIETAMVISSHHSFLPDLRLLKWREPPGTFHSSHRILSGDTHTTVMAYAAKLQSLSYRSQVSGKNLGSSEGEDRASRPERPMVERQTADCQQALSNSLPGPERPGQKGPGHTRP